MLNKKINIPKRVRSIVWEKYIGKKWKGSCYVKWCNNKFNVLSSSWHVGHDIPESKGGSLNISNLRPICSDCNLGMSNQYSIQEWTNTFSEIKKEDQMKDQMKDQIKNKLQEQKYIKKLEQKAVKLLLRF